MAIFDIRQKISVADNESRVSGKELTTSSFGAPVPEIIAGVDRDSLEGVLATTGLGHVDEVAPLRPGTVVVAHVPPTEQLREDEPH